MKRSIVAILLLSTIGTIPVKAQDHSFLRIACQKYYVSDRELSAVVVIVEQLSVERIGGTDIVDGAALVNPGGKSYTGQAAFRMRIFRSASLMSYGKTREEVVEELLRRPASTDLRGFTMDFSGIGSRLNDTFGFGSTSPYDKSLTVDLKDLWNAQLATDNAASTMLEDGFYKCEDPFLMPSAPRATHAPAGSGADGVTAEDFILEKGSV